MTRLEYRGIDLTARPITMTLTGTLTEEQSDGMQQWMPAPDREVRITLGYGERWPDAVKKGQSVTVTLNGYTLTGRVRWRRMRRLVMDISDAP